MAVRYTPDELKFLKESPLVVKPLGLPPAEQWMGTPADPTRNSAKLANEKAKNHSSNLDLDQPNKRPGAERHMSRSSANPEDIILGPPKTSFMSATSIRSAGKPFDSPERERASARDVDTRDRFNFRGGRTGDGDNDRPREGRNNLRMRRNDGDQDSDGWSTVKPRKSFGNEGAERFNGRMGLDRHKDDKRFRDREDRDHKERPARGFDSYSRDKDTDDHERAEGRKNGTGRGRNEPSWFKDSADGAPAPRERNSNSNGDRPMDRSRGWRDKDREDRGDRVPDRGDRRWDRDQRQEREPEWFAEPEEEKTQAHTQEEFQKWKEQMQGKDRTSASKAPAEVALPSADTGSGFFGLEKPKVETPLAIDTGPDKFFGKWATPTEEKSPEAGSELRKEGLAKPKGAGKASRFTSFFAQEEPQGRQPEPLPAMAQPSQGGFDALLANSSQSAAEKEAFQQLLQKLQRQTISGTGTGSARPTGVPIQQKPYTSEKQQSNQIPSQDNFQQYRAERHEEGRPATRNSQQALQELMTQRQVAGSQPTIRPEQMLQELVGQRQDALNRASRTPDQQPARNDNTAFLMGLMQSAKAAPEPQRSEQAHMRIPLGKPIDRQQMQQQQQMLEREEAAQREAAQRERSTSQRARAHPPPGFFDDPAFQRGPPPPHERQSGNPPQPTQILQRPPPPGLEMGWDRASQLPPPQHRINPNVPPPPGLASAPNRGMPVPQQMFPPGFPMGSFPPDVMPGPPRNIPMPPPPGFFNSPPPGFLPPGISGFQGPEGMAFGGAPFDGRGPPPQGAFRRQ
ncbi:Uncharacterized protein BP5553_04332 [Venustampulla echinocandica]|uniref:Uncharacterized protein n=1 Tax=Venustampulla echinocandica TaxID=2656787 RepID=A0A370TWT8_9HELO|nr:Uncharacterized protein BP5553_04332 [Venustampulla echinocandica]RDL39992.1 Uncharacterized protein BP5553_04332 [Venustampulla echinocandica]